MVEHYDLDSTTTEEDVPASAKKDAGRVLSHNEANTDHPEEPPSAHKNTRSHPSNPTTSKASNSDSDFSSEEDVYTAFKNRQSLKRKRGGPSSARKTRKTKAQSSIVGKQPRKRRRKDIHDTLQDTSSDSDEERIEAELPDYIKKRRAHLGGNTDQADETLYRFPPSFNDIDFSDDDHLESLEERPDFPLLEPCAPYEDIAMSRSRGVIPAPIAQWLRDYQVHGASFLHELFVWQKGGILGDDMGLGKTIQIIAFLAAAFGKTGDERDSKRMRKMRRVRGEPWYPRVLVVCPGTLMENWKAEFNRWGWWNIEVYHGAAADKAAALQTARAGRLEVMITTYATYRLSKGDVNLVEWDCVIADECHQIKERRSEMTKAMNEVNSLCRIGLTGTAIQNNYEELWTLLNWANPGRFGPIGSWKKAISEPLRIGQSHDATQRELGRARATALKLSQNLLPQFFLRRMKTLIADQLPKKSDRVVFCPLTATQQEAYSNYVESELVEYIRDSTLECDCGSRKKRGWCCYMRLPYNDQPWQAYAFPCLEALRRISNHVFTLVPSSDDSNDQQSKALEHLQFALPADWQDLYRRRDNILNFANQEFCGKWKILKKLLRFWHAAGDKVLIFSYSRRLLRMLQTLCNATTSYNVSYLDGSMTLPDRTRAVDHFNADPAQFLFLISTRAGGVGLNITSANKVVVVDPNWNPMYDLQAQDRAYRIGQVRDVEVFRLISAGTIEEIVYARQIYKQQQANIGYNASLERRYFSGVQDTKEKKGEIFGLRNLFAYYGGNVVLRDIVNKTNVAESRAGVDVIGLDFESQASPTADESAASDVAGSFDGTAQSEDSAMSQLATSLVTGDADGQDGKASRNGRGKRSSSRADAHYRKADPVQAILASAGVCYTHENAQVVGSSKVESRLSRKAQQAANQASQSIPSNHDRVFVGTEQQRQPDRGQRDRSNEPVGADAAPDHQQHRRYRPPLDVRKRQFRSMARAFGYGDDDEGRGLMDFALLVEGWTQAQRRAALEQFYGMRMVQR